MKINQLKAGSVLSYVQMALGILVGLIYTPTMLRILGQSEYGLYNTVSSTISMLSVLSLGFNSSYIRYYSKYKVKDDREAIYRLNGLFLAIFTLIGVVAFICGLFLVFHLELVFDKGLTVEEYKTARMLMLLLTINLAVSFPFSVFSTIISANERYVFLKIIGMLKTVGGPLVTMPLLLMGYRSVAMVLVTLLVTITVDIVYFIYVHFILKSHFWFRKPEEGLVRDIFAFTAFLALNVIVDLINNNLGKLLLGRFNGTEVVAVFSVGYFIYQSYMTFSTSISGVFSPRVHKIVNITQCDKTEQRLQLTNLFIRVGRIQYLILALIATGLVFFGKHFIYLWAGAGYEDAYEVTLLLTISSTIAFIQNIGIEIQRAQNTHRFRSIVYLLMALMNLGITAKLCPLYGAIGAATGTAVSLVIANGLIMNIYYHKRCNINILLFWKNILRVSVGLVIPIVIGCLMTGYFDYYSFPKLLAGGLVYTGVYCISMWLFGMNQYEKQLIIKPWKNRQKKRKTL